MFRVNCDAEVEDEKGKKVKCGQRDSEPSIDKETMVVYCELGHPFKDQNRFTDFTKRQMLHMGQTRKDLGKKQAYSCKCQSCSREGTPVLSKDNKQLLCQYCKVELALSKPFASTILQILRAKK